MAAQPEASSEGGAPEYMVSYADMLTIMLAFFVVLYASAGTTSSGTSKGEKTGDVEKSSAASGPKQGHGPKAGGGGKEGLGGNAHDLGGPLQEVEFALFAVGTRITRMELRMGHFDPLGSGIVGCGCAAMAFTLGRRCCGCRGGGWWRGKKLAGFLGFSPEDQPLQPANRGLLGLDE